MLCCLCGLLIGTVLWGGPASAADLNRVLAEFDKVQLSIQTLSAEFTETTTNQLLKEPIVAEGRFYMTKPDAIRWEYSSPEEMRFVISRDEYTGYFPARKKAEKRNIQRWRDQLFRFFGLGQGSVELGKFYDIRLRESSAEQGGTYLLVLEPKKRRARRRVDEVLFWLDGSTYLPNKIEYRAKNGNRRLIEFREIRINPDLSAGLYTVELPADVVVTTGFGLLNSSPGASQ